MYILKLLPDFVIVLEGDYSQRREYSKRKDMDEN